MMKTFNSERVDSLAYAVSLECNNVGQQCYGHFDKIAWVTDLFDKQENQVMVDRLFQLESDDTYQVRVRPAGKDECDSLYRWVVEIRLANKSKHHPVLLMIYFGPTNKKRGAVRMELSPQHYLAEQMSDLFIWLGRKGRIGKYLYQGLRNSWVTTIHYALDVMGMKLHDFLIGLAKVHDGDFNDLDGKQEGMRLGATTVVASIYEKVNAPELSLEERRATAQLTLDESQHECFLRLELRLSPGKQKLMLSNLSQMENLVSRLAFYDRKLIKDRKLDPDFAKRLKRMTVPRARKTFRPASELNGRAVSPSKEAAKKRVDKVMKRYLVNLFDAEAIWHKLPLVVDKLGILGQPQYWQLDIRKKWLKSRGK
ncbi:hypothetical protein [Yersinia pseudotuberculosis]|uniref:hypothetical protein n=1 Tax=Yersinia pseudotuberculosis TaxID=633 RepID=UPI00067CA39F|nr:hypothetical protein [Yersinia pseudotuberculosis]AYX11584.1 hypothetical protein EGX52_12880 [Yersinia pseudotuberculosis]